MVYLLVLVLTSCEIANTYTDSYQYKYRRPIGLLMSQKLDSLGLSGRGVKIGVVDAGFADFKKNEFTQNLNVVDYKDFIDEDTSGFQKMNMTMAPS